MRTETAHVAWDATWRTAEGRAAWSRAEPDVVAFGATARISGAERALDLGCGVGRHTVALARLGLSVDAVDASEAGLATTQAATDGLPVRTHDALMTALPFEAAVFDIAVSWNVLYHGDPEVVAGAVGEMARVLKPGARAIVTMLTKRNGAFAVGREVAPDTWVNEAAADDKMHPHFYCDAEGFAAVFRDFHVMTLREDNLGNPGNSHWVATLERKG
jgi:SAM-dependent methyltransferase